MRQAENDFPSLRTVEKGSHRVEARNAIGARDNGGEPLRRLIQGWEVSVDAVLAKRRCRDHGG